MKLLKGFFRIVKTWCEDTTEGESYLKYNGYKNAKRILNTNFYLCSLVGCSLNDVKIIL